MSLSRIIIITRSDTRKKSLNIVLAIRTRIITNRVYQSHSERASRLFSPGLKEETNEAKEKTERHPPREERVIKTFSKSLSLSLFLPVSLVG